MQLNRRFSIAACAILALSSLKAEDYVSVQYMSYDEDSGRTTISTPTFEFNKDIGADYTVNFSFLHDTVTGASPTYYDSQSGASATIPKNKVQYQSDIVYGNIPYDDDRKAMSFSLSKRFASRDELTVGLNHSTENDYTSNEISVEYLYFLDKTKNTSFTFGISYQANKVGIDCFLNTGDCDSTSGASGQVKKDLDVVSAEIGVTQVIDKTSLVKASVFTIDEDGYLTNPYMRVVRNYYTAPEIAPEVKPDSRRAYGATLQYSKAFTDKFSTVLSYRYYDDDWDIRSHTFNSKFYYSWSSKLTTGFLFRGYTQTQAKFYSPRRDYFTNEKYASSDRRMSEFDSYNYSVTVDYKINKKVTLNLGIGYYDQPDYFDSTYYDVGFKYSF